MKFYKPQIVKSPFDEKRLAIAYPVAEDGEWIHKDDIQKEYISKQDVKEAFKDALEQSEYNWKKDVEYTTEYEDYEKVIKDILSNIHYALKQLELE